MVFILGVRDVHFSDEVTKHRNINT